MSDERKKPIRVNEKRRLVIRKETLRRMQLEREDLRHVVGGDVPKVPFTPGTTPAVGDGG